MSKIIMYKGLIASGKSQTAKQYVQDHQEFIEINKDELRLLYPSFKENKILDERNKLIREALSQGKSVIVSDTGFNPVHERTLRAIANEFGAEFEINDSFLKVPLQECIRRDNARANGVGESVIKDMYNKWLRPKPLVIEYDGNLPNCIVCDIDGCLANKSPNRGYYDWKKVG